ncbi:hypothetical protein HETIRDRAFT_244962, partial [Heterobasidion irregulare TC 32-1]
STLFVSNLPYTVTSTDLQTLFSDLAPVRSAFVVLEPGTRTSKGVGYVSFAIKEDAATALDQVAKDGLVLDGRSLRVGWAATAERDANPKPTPAPKPKSEPADAHHPKMPHVHVSRDPLAIRTIIVSGLPTPLDSNALWKKMRKYAGAEHLEWPLKLGNDGEGEDPSTAHVLFSKPAQAEEAVTKLHAHVFKGALLSVTLKKRLDAVAKPPRRPAALPTSTSTATPTAASLLAASVAGRPAGPAPSRASRLIVRNLPFDVTEQDLRAVFLPYGPIYAVHIPTTLEGEEQEKGATEKARTRGKGFAFVWMWSKKEAEKAMEGCNGTKVRAGFAAGLVKDKQKRKKERREDAKRLKAAAGAKDDAEEEDEEDGEGEGEAEAGKRGEGYGEERVIAVDWALSKEKWEEEKKKIADDAEDEDEESDEDEEDSDEEDSALGLHDHDSEDESRGSSADEDDEEDEDDRSDAGERVKPELPPPEAGTTLFVRNVPFSATDEELRALFRTFGPLRYARITLDHDTGRSRGTGFACFWNKVDADKAVAQSEILRSDMMGQSDAPKKNPFSMPSLLTPDPSALSAQSLVLHGRTLDVVRAVTRDEAGRLKEVGEKAREKADKRNMYLLREGVILPNTPAASTLPAVEIEKRTNSFNARRALLRSNPALYVSKTRLSVRQLPPFVTERGLRRLATHAVRAFDREVKAGTRAGLTRDELQEGVEAAPEGGADAEKGKDAWTGKGKEKEKGRKEGRKGWSKAGRNAPLVRQAKIVRQADRVDTATGLGRSRGYGFVELRTHADALRVLRWANNSRETEGLFAQWWAAEAGERATAEEAKGEDGKKRAEKLKKEAQAFAARGTGKEEAAGDEVEAAEGVAEKRGKGKGTLIVEFSIENVQVVQRRA